MWEIMNAEETKRWKAKQLRYKKPIVRDLNLDKIQEGLWNIMEECEKAVQLLKSQGYNPGLVNVRFIRPMDEEMLHVLSKKYSLIVTVEENQLIGGYGQMVSAFLHKNVCKNQLLTLGISDYFVGHATVNEQREEAGINATVINPYYITGLDEALLTKLKQNHDTVITLEDGILDGGFGEKIARFYGASNMKVMNYGLKKEFLDRYDVDAVLKENHLTAEQIVEDVLSIL